MDLCAVRRNAGFTQRDIAHLAGISQTRYSSIESGKLLPTITELVVFSIVLGHSIQSLNQQVRREVLAALPDRVSTLPVDVRRYSGTKNRATSINRLEERLTNHADYAG